MAQRKKFSVLLPGGIQQIDPETFGDRTSRFKGKSISQGLYEKLGGGRGLSSGQFERAEQGAKRPISVIGRDVISDTRKGLFGDRVSTTEKTLSGISSARTKVGSADLLSETMKANADPYLLFKSLGVEAELTYDVSRNVSSDRFRDWILEDTQSSHQRTETAQFNFDIDQQTQEAVIDYEQGARSAFMNSYFSREF